MQKYTLFFGMLFCFLIACQIDDDCEWIDEYPELDDLVSVEMTIVNLPIPLESLELEIGDSYIIRDDSTYQTLLSDSIRMACDSCELPIIDFDEKLLLGYYTQKNCSVYSTLSVLLTQNNDYQFYSKQHNPNQCMTINCIRESLYWVSVSAISDTNNVFFQEVNTYYDCDC